MEAKNSLLQSLRAFTNNLKTSYEKLLLVDDGAPTQVLLQDKQMPIDQIIFYLKQAQQQHYQIRVITKTKQILTGRIQHITADQRLILTSTDHRQNALLPFATLASVQRI